MKLLAVASKKPAVVAAAAIGAVVSASVARASPAHAEAILGDLVTAGFTQENAARGTLTSARTMCPDVLPRLQAEANAAQRPKVNAAI